jgi:hypothetical protein
MRDPWIDEFIASFPSPEPDEALVQGVRLQMREVLAQESEERRLLLRRAAFVAAAALASVPPFFALQYFYYTALRSVLAVLSCPFGGILLAAFAVLATLTGAMFYGSIPIWTAFWLRQRET